MSMTVLVVDDEMLIALDIQAQLEERGHEVITAASVSEALAAIAARDDIALAILDWHVGSGDAAPLARELSIREIPFVICSGSMVEEVAERFADVPYVPKPFSPDQLVDAVARAAARRSASLN